MVARLEEAGVLRPGPVRDALLAIRREVLIPQAYVRRSQPGEEPPRWDLLDWAEPANRDELLTVLYGGESVLVLRNALREFTAVEKEGAPSAQAVAGACMVVTDIFGRVMLGRSSDGVWELPGGGVEPGEDFPTAAVRELAEEAGLSCRVEDAHLVAILQDDRGRLRRLSGVVRTASWSGEPAVPDQERHRFALWEWHDLHALAALKQDELHQMQHSAGCLKGRSGWSARRPPKGAVEPIKP